MVTSHNYGLHNNNVCVAKERLMKDIELGYNNLYITMKNCVQGANMYMLEGMPGIYSLYNNSTPHNYNKAWIMSSMRNYKA